MKRSGPIPRHRPIRRTSAKRASEWARIYGSVERVAWVKSLPCLGCNWSHPLLVMVGLKSGGCDNAHVKTDGMGRKANADQIVPLCRSCHQAYDEHRAPFNTPEARDYMKMCATRVAAAWQGRQT